MQDIFVARIQNQYKTSYIQNDQIPLSLIQTPHFTPLKTFEVTQVKNKQKLTRNTATFTTKFYLKH